MKISKTAITKFLILTIILTAALSVNYLFAAWTGPTQAPPDGNTPTPIHVGLTTQTKEGGFLAGGLRSFGDLYVDGNVGIGTVSPTQKLEVTGNIQASGIICDSNGCIGSGGDDGGGITPQKITCTGIYTYSIYKYPKASSTGWARINELGQVETRVTLSAAGPGVLGSSDSGWVVGTTASVSGVSEGCGLDCDGTYSTSASVSPASGLVVKVTETVTWGGDEPGSETYPSQTVCTTPYFDTTINDGGGSHGDGTNCSSGQAPRGVDANGNVQGCFTPAGGGLISGHEIRTASADLSASVNCSAGKKVTGGGCIVGASGINIFRDFPSSDSQWTCVGTMVGVTVTAYAICIDAN